MAKAINFIIETGGADVVVAGSDIKGALPLPIGGIMSDLEWPEFTEAQNNLHALVATMGFPMSGDPFLHLGILGITAVPDVGMSVLGPIDAATHKVLDVVLAD
jgi:adenine deaminase